MNVILGEEEIRNFPVEIRDFLKSYLIERFEHGGNNTNISKGNIGIPKPFATDDSYNQDGFIEAPSFTKHPNRWLVIDERFDWFRFLEMAFTSPKGKNSNELTIKLDKNRKPIFEFSEQNIDPEDSKSWGICIIFCSMFGFGGKIPDFEKAKTIKELCENLEKTNLTKGKPISEKSMGPLLKSITSQFRIESARQDDEVAVAAEKLHWFTFLKSTNEFFFAGDTEKLCYEAAGKFTEQCFMDNN